jgi:hypothetical protein
MSHSDVSVENGRPLAYDLELLAAKVAKPKDAKKNDELLSTAPNALRLS